MLIVKMDVELSLDKAMVFIFHPRNPLILEHIDSKYKLRVMPRDVLDISPKKNSGTPPHDEIEIPPELIIIINYTEKILCLLFLLFLTEKSRIKHFY